MHFLLLARTVAAERVCARRLPTAGIPISQSLAAVGVSGGIVQGALFGPIVKRIGERRALVIGLMCGALGFAVYGLAPTGRLFLIGVPIMALWGLYGPSAQSLMTSRVGQSEQGQLQGALSSITGMANMIAPAVFSLVFAAAISTFRTWRLPGAPFILASAILVGGGAGDRGHAPALTGLRTAA